MNVLLLNINLGNERLWGGMESHSSTLASLLSGRGHKVIVGCSNEGSVEVAGKLALPARRITIANSGDLPAIIKMARVCSREGVQVVIANHGREYWPATVAARMAGARVIFVRHQIDRLKRTTCWLVNRHVEKVIAVSSAVKDDLLASGVSGEKVEIVYNSVSLARFNPSLIDREDARGELGIDGDSIVVGTAGKLDRGKGVFELLHAVSVLAKKYPFIRLVFVGEGSERDNLAREARGLSIIGKVIFAGARKDMERMYAAMDIFVLPSTCREAFGMVLIEAMAMQKPVIGTSVGGVQDIIAHNVNGLIVLPGDEGAISDAIAGYIENKESSRRMAIEARRTVELKFSDGILGDRFAEILEGLPVRR